MDTHFSTSHLNTITIMTCITFFMGVFNFISIYSSIITMCIGTGIIMTKIYNKNIVLSKCTVIYWCLWSLYFMYILIRFVSLSNYIEFHYSLLIVGTFAALHSFNNTFKQWFNKIIRNQYFLYIFCSIEMFLTNILEISLILNFESQMMCANSGDVILPSNWRIYTDNDIQTPNNSDFNSIINHSEFSKFVSNGMEGNEQLNAMTNDLINMLVSAKMGQINQNPEPVSEIPVSSTDETDILSPESLYSTDSGDELNISPITPETDSETYVFNSTNNTFEYPNNAHC
jgi:hypothetical protein